MSNHTKFPTIINEISFKQVNNDVNGNSRFVCHFLNLLTDADKAEIRKDFAASLSINPLLETSFQYAHAIAKAKKIGGKGFHNKQYGGGIVFTAHYLPRLREQIAELVK